MPIFKKRIIFDPGDKPYKCAFVYHVFADDKQEARDYWGEFNQMRKEKKIKGFYDPNRVFECTKPRIVRVDFEEPEGFKRSTAFLERVL